MINFLKNTLSRRGVERQDIIKLLHSILDPVTGLDVSAAGLVQSVHIQPDQSVIVTLVVPTALAGQYEAVRFDIEKAVAALPRVSKAMVILTAEREGNTPLSNRAITPLAPENRKQKPGNSITLVGVKHIIAVASGKGGVGKSTVAANLAVSLSQMGLSIGLMDADIYGPSVPRLMGIAEKKPEYSDDGKINPLFVHGIKVMSMGFLVAEETPMIWRGPMVQSAILQLLRDVHWATPDAPLDILVIDMPPGTGDAQLTLAQKVPLSGAVIVSTPQDIALLDARKGIAMFDAVSVPVLGVVENMSYFCCPNCGHRADIFNHGGARSAANKMGVSFLGEIPLHADIRALSDSGQPVALDHHHEQSHAFASIAGKLRAILDSGVMTKKAPLIVIEE